MRTLKITGIVVGGLVVLVLVVGLFLPSSFEVSRSIEIAAPDAVIFAEVNDLRRWEAWSPWQAHDDTMVNTYSENTAGVGAWSEWTGEHSGAGKMIIVESVLNRRVVTDLAFDGQGKGNGFWTLEPVGDTVRTTWTFKHEVGWSIPGRYFGLVMESMLGPYMEEGLASLKAIAEKTPVAAAEPPPELPTAPVEPATP